jgi:hypothetical protein
MINFFMGKLNKMDPDIIVCHGNYDYYFRFIFWFFRPATFTNKCI